MKPPKPIGLDALEKLNAASKELFNKTSASLIIATVGCGVDINKKKTILITLHILKILQVFFSIIRLQ